MSRPVSKEEWAAVVAEARNPSERAVLCALAKFANRTNGVVQEPRAVLAATATMAVASFRTHAAALSGRERGLIAATTMRATAGDYDTTIYTLIGWLHLRGMSEPEHLRLGAQAETREAPEGEGSASIEQGSAKISHGGLPKSSRPGVVEFSRPPSGEFQQTSAKIWPTHKESAPARVGDNSQPLEISGTSYSPFPRARGSTGKLQGDAGEIVALVNHPKLDPEKDFDLVARAGHYVERWKRLGLTVKEIAFEICVVLERRDRRNAGADRISTWEYFDKAMTRAASAKSRAAAEPVLETSDERNDRPGPQPRFDNLRPLSAAEREQSLAGDRRASWGRAIAQARGGSDG